jgi:hypothetical protein
MLRVPLLVLLIAIAAGCGSDDGPDAGTTTSTTTRTTTVSAADAERALETELGKGGGGGGVVDLERPEQVMCVSEKGGGARWHCTIKPKGGRDYVCDVEVDTTSKRSTKSSCAAVDN